MTPAGKQKQLRMSVALAGILLSFALLSLGLVYVCNQDGGNSSSMINVAYGQTGNDSAASARAFLKAYRVLLHPRCMNCHPAGDSPLAGDQSRPHPMNVKRGPEGLGENGLWCSTCHQEKNLQGEHLPPGAPGWQLPTKTMPMVFQNKTPRQLCEQMKDPERNGNRTPKEILEHVQEAPLVLWGWNPGDGRTPIPVSHEEFVKDVRTWAENGAACPE